MFQQMHFVEGRFKLYDVLRSGESSNPDKELLHESLRTETAHWKPYSTRS